MPKDFIERRSEPRSIADKYYSVEFSVGDMAFVYQFKIWDISSKGLSVLVKEDSELLNHLKVGEIVRMKYYSTDSTRPTEYLRTEIIHISKDERKRFKGHYLVGLSILENQDSDEQRDQS
jgi:hypothetical protein